MISQVISSQVWKKKIKSFFFGPPEASFASSQSFFFMTFLYLYWSHRKKPTYVTVLRIRDVYPGSRILIFTYPGSRISDPRSKNNNKREGWKKSCCYTFFCNHKFHKIENYLIFKMLEKKGWASFQRIIELLTQKFFTKLSKIWVWDPGSEIRDPEKNYSGSRFRIQGSKMAPDPGSATLICKP